MCSLKGELRKEAERIYKKTSVDVQCELGLFHLSNEKEKSYREMFCKFLDWFNFNYRRLLLPKYIQSEDNT